MKDRSSCNRREFVQVAGSCLGAVSLGLPFLARTTPASEGGEPRFAYIGFGGEGAKDEGIAVFDLRSGRWRQMGVIASATPSSLALGADERFLYAVNEVDEYEGLPSGTVEAYAIDATDGSLMLMNRQKLSLSATAPRHAAVSPDGKSLVVAVHGGGAYNVMPLGADGSVGAVSGILKETGAGPHEEQRSSHPQMVVFDRAGRVVSADLGSDRLCVLKLGTVGLGIAGRSAAQAGDGPRQIAIHPDGRVLFVANELNASVAWYRYDPDEGKIMGRLGQVATAIGGNAGGVAMALDPQGEFLYTTNRSGSGGVSMWRIARGTGSLQRLQVEGGPPMREMAMTADGKSLFGLSRENGGVFGWRVANGQLNGAAQLASMASPISMATKSL